PSALASGGCARTMAVSSSTRFCKPALTITSSKSLRRLTVRNSWGRRSGAGALPAVRPAPGWPHRMLSSGDRDCGEIDAANDSGGGAGSHDGSGGSNIATDSDTRGAAADDVNVDMYANQL
ncbi:unnamed protein product, partial [Phaeothamnion confervicola]